MSLTAVSMQQYRVSQLESQVPNYPLPKLANGGTLVLTEYDTRLPKADPRNVPPTIWAMRASMGDLPSHHRRRKSSNELDLSAPFLLPAFCDLGGMNHDEVCPAL